jgi:hypothetical protein
MPAQKPPWGTFGRAKGLIRMGFGEMDGCRPLQAWPLCQACAICFLVPRDPKLTLGENSAFFLASQELAQIAGVPYCSLPTGVSLATRCKP